ncbi:MAG: hypothetical protein HGB12_09875 [Bacteroidetes bacterium]|nr:hypothetical protein [Bacteroidota bacterium]
MKAQKLLKTNKAVRSIAVALLFFYFSFFAFYTFSQSVAINTTGDSAVSSAILDVSSTEQGVLLPRISTLQRDAIASPSIGLLIFNTDCEILNIYTTHGWQSISASSIVANTPPYIADAGSDQNLECGINTTTLEGNAPIVGTGYWSVVSGAAVITTPNSPTSGVTGLNELSSAILRWTIYNSPCNASTDDVVINTSGSCCPCSGIPTVTDIDGNVYNTVSIGTQCWMKENLKTGTLIPISTHQTNNGILEKYCYDNDIAHCDSSGAIYQWAEAVQYINGASNSTLYTVTPTGNVQGICPTGWHIPKVAEWNTLTTFLGGESVAGGKMKVTAICGTKPCWKTPNTDASNSSCFSAFSSGESYNESTYGFGNNSYYLYYWTPDETFAIGGLSGARAYRLDYNQAWCILNSKYKTSGLSIRCLKD